MTLIPQLFNIEPGLNDIKLGRRQVVQNEVFWKDIQNKPTNLSTTQDIKNAFDALDAKIQALESKIQNLENRVQTLENTP